MTNFIPELYVRGTVFSYAFLKLSREHIRAKYLFTCSNSLLYILQLIAQRNVCVHRISNPVMLFPYVGGVGMYKKECEEIVKDGYKGFLFE